MAVTGTPRIGKARKCYLDIDGDIASPTWVELGKIQGLSKNYGRNLAELEERDVDDVTVMPGHMNREVTIELTHRPGNTSFDAIQDAHEAGSKIGLAIMSGVITNAGEVGYQAEFYVTGWDDDEAHTNSTVSVTVRPAADFTTAPAFVQISGG